MLEEGADGFLGIAGVEEGAILVAASAAEDFGGRDHEPDDIAELAEEGAVFGAGDDATPGGDDVAFGGGGGEIPEDGRFEVAEGGFPLVRKDFGDWFADALDDEGVGVDERIAEGSGKIPADGRLAGAHESDQNDVFVGVFGHAVGKV